VTLGSHQRSIGGSQNWISPLEIVNPIGPFDLDPCAAEPRPWDCAKVNWTSDGLEKKWFSRVYCNPVFDRREVGKWVARMAAHNNGTVLIHARTEAGWFEPIWQHASAILFLADRLHFHYPDGTRAAANSGAPACLVAFGQYDAERLAASGIPGTLVTGWQIQSGHKHRGIWRRLAPASLVRTDREMLNRRARPQPYPQNRKNTRRKIFHPSVMQPLSTGATSLGWILKRRARSISRTTEPSDTPPALQRARSFWPMPSATHRRSLGMLMARSSIGTTRQMTFVPPMRVADALQRGTQASIAPCGITRRLDFPSSRQSASSIR
jgi:hypothetical protein